MRQGAVDLSVAGCDGRCRQESAGPVAAQQVDILLCQAYAGDDDVRECVVVDVTDINRASVWTDRIRINGAVVLDDAWAGIRWNADVPATTEQPGLVFHPSKQLQQAIQTPSHAVRRVFFRAQQSTIDGFF